MPSSRCTTSGSAARRHKETTLGARACLCGYHVQSLKLFFMAAPIQRVSVPSYAERSSVRPYVVYVVRVELPVQTWTVERRYSEFAALHAAFPIAPPARLPPKDGAWQAVSTFGGLLGGRDDAARIEERRSGLEHYIRAIVAAEDPLWRNHAAFCDFLKLPCSAAPAPQPVVARDAITPRDAPPPVRPTTFQRPQLPAVETTETRALNNAQLLEHQVDTLMARQDKQAEALASVLQRQRAIGMDIHDELLRHHELLGELSTAVQSTQQRLDRAHVQARRLE